MIWNVNLEVFMLFWKIFYHNFERFFLWEFRKFLNFTSKYNENVESKKIQNVIIEALGPSNIHCWHKWLVILNIIQITTCFFVFLKLSKVFLVVWVLLPDMAFLELSQFPSNLSPFSKLSKVYCCCVHAASRHGHLFSVSFKSPIFQAFQSL